MRTLSLTPKSKPGFSLAWGVVLSSCGIGFCLVILAQGHLPGNVGTDTLKIQLIAQRSVTYHDRGFMAIGWVYRQLGLANSPLMAGIVTFLVYIATVLCALRARDLEDASLLSVLVCAGTVAIGGIFLGRYAKELVILPVTMLMTSRRTYDRRHEAVVFVAMLLVAYYLRSYWYLVALGYLGMRVLFHRTTAKVLHAGAPVVMLLVLALAFREAMHIPLDYYRVRGNSQRAQLGIEVNTLISSPIVATGIVSSWASVCVVFGMLLVPVSLLVKGGFYTFAGLLVCAIWLMVIVAYARYLAGQIGRDPLVERALSLIVAFVVVQATFEPDYGSALRHLTPILPLCALVVVRLDRRNTVSAP